MCGDAIDCERRLRPILKRIAKSCVNVHNNLPSHKILKHAAIHATFDRKKFAAEYRRNVWLNQYIMLLDHLDVSEFRRCIGERKEDDSKHNSTPPFILEEQILDFPSPSRALKHGLQNSH